jgi:UDP-N-acetylmuramoyl-tripeptide--D-alanyl-D-alanine ligase
MNLQAVYELYLQYPSVQTDTRKLQKNDLFFALSGPNFNGNTFALQALEKGAVHVIIDDPAYATSQNCTVVPNVLEALQQLASLHITQLNIPVLAITGSNGKTTTKELIHAVLQKKHKTTATEGNLNNHIGVPITILKIKSGTEIAIIEMGANHQKEIASYCQIAHPNYGLITNCGKAHIEGFGGEEGVKKGKGELYDFIRDNGGSIFRDTSLSYLNDMAKGINEQITYGEAYAQYTGEVQHNGAFINVVVDNNGTSNVVTTQLVGGYNFPNVMAAVAVGRHFGVPMEAIAAAIAGYQPSNSRSQWMEVGSNHVILDAYNANPTSMKAAIDNFATLALPNKILWIGGMKEMGIAEQYEHQAIVSLIDTYEWKSVILVGAEFKGLAGKHSWFETSIQAAESVAKEQPVNSNILIKGSRGSQMELLHQVLATQH